MLRLTVPHLYVESVCELTPERLRELGIDALLLDVDCTLKRYRGQQVGDDVAAWIEELRARGFGLCLLSNGWGRRIGRLAGQLDLPFVAKALKPLPFALKRAIRKLGFSRSKTAMVGDQLFADIMAARLAGVTAILVEPMHPEEEPLVTRVKRPLERFLLRRILKGK